MECAQDIKDRMEVWDKVLTHYNESGKNASVNTEFGNDALNNTESDESALFSNVSEMDGLAINKSGEVELDKALANKAIRFKSNRNRFIFSKCHKRAEKLELK